MQAFSCSNSASPRGSSQYLLAVGEAPRLSLQPASQVRADTRGCGGGGGASTLLFLTGRVLAIKSDRESKICLQEEATAFQADLKTIPRVGRRDFHTVYLEARRGRRKKEDRKNELQRPVQQAGESPNRRTVSC